ncbi:MAG: VWA domain-containing protein [Candidatus Aminicenantes bacterium]|nr:VWA domain-containing protein [Candidatus Aminicenantes bacterium]
MKKSLLLVACGLILFLPCLGISGQKQDLASRAVHVDVIVTQNNEFVKDLGQNDFKLFDDGKEVPVEGFELQENKPETAGDGVKKLVVIFHDMSFWDISLKQQVGEIADELANLSRQGIEITVLQMNWLEDLRVLQPFTKDEALVRKAAETATGSVGEDGIHEDLWEGNIREETGTTVTADREKGMRQAYLSVGRRRFEKALGGLLTTCNMIKSSPGRKSVLLISNGIPDLGSSNQSDILNSGLAGRDALDAIHSRDQQDIGGVRIFDPFNIMKNDEFSRSEDVIRELIRFANTNNISIYALDPGVFSKSRISGTSESYMPDGVSANAFVGEEKGKQLQNLRLIAEDTNAVLFRGANKYEKLRLILNADLSAHYQLSFTPKRKNADDRYHEIRVQIDRKGADVRARKGYRDYTEEEAARSRLVSAYYSPDLFKQLPFAGEFQPFHTDKGKTVPWMSIALPTRPLFVDRAGVSASKNLELNIWLKKSGEKAYGGKIVLPFTVDSSFLDRVRKREYLWFFFTGPELEFEPGEYQAVYALFDPETNEIGTWHSSFSFGDLKKSPAPVFLNCVLGAVAENPEAQRDVFSLNKDSGDLEYGAMKFFPQVTNRFSMHQGDLYVFLQVYDPSGMGKVLPEFLVSGKPLTGGPVAESWNKKTKIWSGIIKMDFRFVAVADHVFQAKLPGAEGESVLGPEIRFTKLNY